MERKRYPTDWEEISRRIRFERARGQCECTGECSTHEGRCERRQGDPTTNPCYRVVLTVAHLDARGGPCRCGDEDGSKCGNEEHLKAMCARCHLIMDLPDHIRHAAHTRRMKRIEAGAQLLPGYEFLLIRD